MSTILVTGGSGFIGSNLCQRLLELGHNVMNLDNFNDFYDPKIKWANIKSAQSHSNYTLIEGDIRDSRVLEKIFNSNTIDIVIHLAAIAGVRKSISNPSEYVDIDIKGTVNILEYCRKYNIKKLIFASSSSVYGTNSIPFNEKDCISSQISPYAAAKASGELFCKTYSSLYKIPIICLRFFSVYGPRQRPEMAIHNFTKLINEGKEVVIYGDGKSKRDYTYIDDIVDGIIASINYNCEFEIFNLGHSEPVNINDLIKIIEAKLDKNAYKRYHKMQAGDVQNTYANIDKAKKLLNYKPKVGIQEGIERFVAWYNNNFQNYY